MMCGEVRSTNEKSRLIRIGGLELCEGSYALKWAGLLIIFT